MVNPSLYFEMQKLYLIILFKITNETATFTARLWTARKKPMIKAD